ncbi:MAG: enoyl-CoA hydratase [Chloroflexi bacterium]|nr:MAG: enoyl-CoA hydratase [Chloroflexota bacterium]
MSDQLLFDVNEHVATLTLNRPDKLNAFTLEMVEAWAAALQECRKNSDIHVIVVTGAGRGFCAGGDLVEMRQRVEETPFQQKDFIWSHVHEVAKTLELIDKPVIAAINGVANGAGLDMALMCDMRFAAEDARLAESYIRVGLVPGDGGAYFLTRLVGTAKALELLWTGDTLTAQEALALGIVNKVVPNAELLDYTYSFAQRLVNSPTLCIRAIKRLVYQSHHAELRSALDAASSLMGIVGSSNDHREALAALAEKRKPVFTGS